MAALPFALYRYFDQGDRLLYIGISGNVPVRETTHIGRSRWMELAAGSKIKRYGTADEALAAEAAAIKAEHPLFNVQHNDTPEAWARLWDYLDEIGRPDLLTPKQRRKAPAPKPTAAPEWPRGIADLYGQPYDEEPRPVVTRLAAGAFTLEVRHIPSVALEISAGGFRSVVPLTAMVAFDLADALKHHAWLGPLVDDSLAVEVREEWNKPADDGP